MRARRDTPAKNAPKDTESATDTPATAPQPGAAPTRRTPIRTCVACRTSGGKRGLLRIVRLPAEKAPEAESPEPGETPPASTVVVDPGGKKNGRGAYVCQTIECVEKALDPKRKPLERALKTPIPANLIDALRAAIAGN